MQQKQQQQQQHRMLNRKQLELMEKVLKAQICKSFNVIVFWKETQASFESRKPTENRL